MNKLEKKMEQWKQSLYEKAPGFKKTVETLGAVGNVIGLIGIWIYRFRSVFMSIPVVWAALKLAKMNSELLPETVGIDLQASGEYAYLITRESAVTMPLMVTAVCIAMMFLSRKNFYPWIISIFSLVLPLLILLTNVFPR